MKTVRIMGVSMALKRALRRPFLACLLAALPSLAAAQNASLVLGIGAFTAETDGLSDAGEMMGDGLADMLHTDILNQLQNGDYKWCPAVLTEVRRRQLILDELEFQQTKYADPTTAIKREDWNLLVPDILIEGAVNVAGDGFQWTIRIKDNTSGAELHTLEGQNKLSEMFDVSGSIARSILNLNCRAGYNVTGGGPRITVTGQIARLDEQFELRGAFPGGTVVFLYTPTSKKGGVVQYALTGGGFSGAGTGTYTVTDPGDGGEIDLLQETDGCIDGIPNSCKRNNERLLLTPMFK